MATPRISHGQRELIVLSDLEASFQNFTGHTRTWSPIPEGQDPPDFISRQPEAVIGLELREWLDGDQMGPAKRRESLREQAHRVLSDDWPREHQPKNFRGAFPSLIFNERISRADEQPLRQQFSLAPLTWTALGLMTSTTWGTRTNFGNSRHILCWGNISAGFDSTEANCIPA